MLSQVVPVALVLLFSLCSQLSYAGSINGLTSSQRRLKQNVFGVVRLGNTTLVDFTTSSLNGECPIFIICSALLNDRLERDRSTCVSVSSGNLSQGNWVYLTTPGDRQGQLLLNVDNNETIRCRIAKKKVDGSLQFLDLEDLSIWCELEIQSTVTNQKEVCRLANGGQLTLLVEGSDSSPFNNSPRSNRQTSNLDFAFSAIDLQVNENTVVEAVIVTVVFIMVGTACSLFCRSSQLSRQSAMEFELPERQTERFGRDYTLPPLFCAGTPQSKVSSSRKSEPIVILNPSSFSSPAKWFTNRLFMLGAKEPYSSEEPASIRNELQYSHDAQMSEIELQNTT
eukprot:TRINITY_DN16465_c0_g1_i6.p2 TRINITY_DN16465_c0_g1~~TRINITY_DN16465_c0_g1_i6.p2  ORF type:complete len:339 (-),score=13.69 TRINITY_DN16465_c0_g1_i6:972-1988(-)